MDRFQDSRQTGNQSLGEGVDAGFLGVNMRLDPALLRTGHQYYDLNKELMGPGMMSLAINARFSKGIAETRPGMAQPVEFNPSGFSGTLYGSGAFSDPNGRDSLLLVETDKVWVLSDGVTPSSVAIDAGYEVTTPCSLLQTFDSVLLLRDEGTILQWDGSPTSTFTPINQTESGDYTETIPTSQIATVMSNRVFITAARDVVAASLILDYTRYDSALSAFRINTGEDDAIVAMAPYRRTNLVVFKEQSIHVLQNVSGDLSDVRAEVVNVDLGCIARRSVATVGSELFFLATNGIYRLGEVMDNSMATQERPVSEPIQPLIDRINFEHVHKACAVVSGDYYKLAVPLDSSEEPNAVLVYDTVRGQWQGYDTFAVAVGINDWQRVDYQGRKRAWMIDNANSRALMTDWGHCDDIDGTLNEIITTMRTRGYVLGSSDPQYFRNARLVIETCAPSFTVSTIVDGVNETRAIASNVTRSRTKYHRFGVEDWDDSNANDDADDPGREDYCVVLDQSGGTELGTNGLILNQRQETIESYPLRDRGRWLAMELTNTQGSIALKAVTVDARPKRNYAKTQS